MIHKCWLMVLFATVSPAFAQVEFGFDFRAALTRGELADNIEDDGFGLDGWVGFQVPGAPLIAGFDLGFIHFGDTRVDGRGEIDEIRTDNNVINLNVMLRLQPRHGPIRPYVEGFMGLNHFVTSTTIVYEDFDDDLIDFDRDFDDTTYAAGIGAGLSLVLSHWVDDDGDRSAFSLDIGARYVRGSEAEYVIPDSVVLDPFGDLEFTVAESETDYIDVRFGFSWKL